MPEGRGLCRTAIGSVSHASRAESVLARAAIRARAVKISSGESSGCIYGIEIPCSQIRNAEGILRELGIRPRGWSEVT